MNALDNKEILAFLVDWLRVNNLRRTEQTLLEELELSVKEEVQQLPTRPLDPQYREKSYPFEPDCGEVGPVVLETPVTEGDSFTDGVDPNLENDEVDVVNFEASLAEQLKQLVNDLSQHGLPPPMPPLETPSSPTQSDIPGSPVTPIDEWTDPDDIGFVRIHARPGEELYELCDDAEHRAKAEAYVAMVQAQQQASAVSNTSPLPRDPTSPLIEPQSPDIVPGDVSKQSGNLSPIHKENGTTPESETTSPLSSITASPALGDGAATWDGTSTPTEVASESQGNPSKRYPPPTSPTTAPVPTKKYPVYEAFDLKVVYEVNRTGFEEHKDYPIRMHGIIAGRYQILEYLGSAAFSRAVQCVDLKTGQLVCVKIIRNNKDFFDQGLDEIKLLQYINSSGDADESCVLQLYDYFYHKEHLFLVCELLRDNLYEFSKYNRESGDEPYFTIPRLQRIAKQVLTALQYVHSLNLIHCDLKPENILIKSYSRCEIKVIDFGSTCFTTDHLSSYVQSRCYRAPEVILGLPYGPKIDLWSLGAILPELFNGRVLFQNDSVPTMLARIVAIRGPIPDCMIKAGKYTNRFYTRRGTLYERDKDTGAMSYLYPKPTILKARVGTDDELFLDFINCLLSLNPETRLTASEALRHPWLLHDYGPVR